MPQKRLFGHDPLTGITQYWHVTDKGEYVIETQQDVTAIAKKNKAERNSQDGSWGEGRKIGSIPLNIFYDLKRKGIIDDPKAFLKWLQDSENKSWRTKEGRLI